MSQSAKSKSRRHYKVDSRFVGDLYTLTYASEDDEAESPEAEDAPVSPGRALPETRTCDPG